MVELPADTDILRGCEGRVGFGPRGKVTEARLRQWACHWLSAKLSCWVIEYVLKNKKSLARIVRII